MNECKWINGRNNATNPKETMLTSLLVTMLSRLIVPYINATGFSSDRMNKLGHGATVNIKTEYIN